MNKSKSILMLLAGMFMATAFTSCDDDNGKVTLPEQTTVKYYLSVSPDFLQFYDITVSYKTAAGIEQTATVTTSPWKFQETVNGRYYIYKFNTTATLKTPYTIPADQKEFTFQWNSSAYFTNNTASNTYSYNPTEYVFNETMETLQEFFDKHASIKLTEFEGDKTPK